MKKEIEVLVVGAGALGNAVVWNLGLRGVGRVWIADPDRVEAKNLGLARGFDAAMVGRAKASALAEAARVEFPETEWRAFEGEIADLGWGRIAGSAVIFGCVDRDSARLEVARIGTRLGIAVCDGGLGVAGRVSYFPVEGPCFGCRLTAARRRELLSTWRSQAFPCQEPETETSRVTTVEQVAATGALQVEMGLAGGAAVTTEIRSNRVTSFDMSVSDGCPFHGDQPAPAPFAKGISLGWEWPICVRARCLECAAEWAPMVRRARLKGCPSCGSAEILPLECVDQTDGTLEDPRRIGLPEDHRYTVRMAKAESE